MYVQLGILMSVAIFFLAGMHILVIPLLKKHTENISLLPLSWGTGILFIVALIAQQVASYFFQRPIIDMSDLGILLWTATGLSIMPLLYGKTLKLQSLCLLTLCFIGTFAIPLSSLGLSNFLYEIVIRLLLAGGWTFFILTCTEIDRVPLEGFILNMAFFLLFLLMSIDTFSILPSNLFPFLTTVLTLILLTLFLFRRLSFFWMSFPMVYVVTFLAGYFFCRLAIMPNGAYVAIMLGYPLMETLIALAINIYLYRRILPLSVPFLTERAFNLNLAPKKIFQKVFYAMIITGLIGLLGMRSSMNYFGVSFIMAIIILYSLFIGFTHNMTKVSLKTVGNDVKNGWQALYNEVKTFSSQQFGDQDNTMSNSNGNRATTDNETQAETDLTQTPLSVPVKDKKSNKKNKKQHRRSTK